MTVTIPVDDIVGQAREVRFSRVMMTLAFGLLWLPGWLAAKCWLGLVVAAIAIRRGWRDGTGWTPPPPRREAADGYNKR